MTDLQPLTTLLGQTERQRDAAIAEHLRLLLNSQAAETQVQQLVAYRREYEQRWSLQFCREGRMELVHCYQSFMDRLTLAVEQQSRIAEHAVQEVQRAVTVMREAEMRCVSVRKLIERRLTEHRLHADRREQKQSDESAARAAWQRIGATRPAPLM